MFEFKVKFSILAVSTALGITAFASSPTSAADFNIQFFNQSSNKIGQGTFSAEHWDDEFAQLFKGSDTSKINVGTIKNWLYVKSFQARIDRFFGNSTYANFWDPDQKRFKHLGFLNNGEAYLLDYGLFGKSDQGGEAELVLDESGFTEILNGELLVDGIWGLQADAISVQTSDAVPEAPTILGSLTAIGLLSLFKRVISKKTKANPSH